MEFLIKIRVLLVEDEALIALDIAQQLTDYGFEVVGPGSTVSRALTRQANAH